MLNTVRFVFGAHSAFAELQMHHKAILDYNDASHAHDHYNHFRSSLKDKYEEQLNPMLERQIIFFKEIPNTLAIGGLALVTLAVLVQGAKKLDLKLPKLLGKEKANKIELSKV